MSERAWRLSCTVIPVLIAVAYLAGGLLIDVRILTEYGTTVVALVTLPGIAATALRIRRASREPVRMGAGPDPTA